jgi:hypothetical protein
VTLHMISFVGLQQMDAWSKRGGAACVASDDHRGCERAEGRSAAAFHCAQRSVRACLWLTPPRPATGTRASAPASPPGS